MLCFAKNAARSLAKDEEDNLHVEFNEIQEAHFLEWIQDSSLLEDKNIRIWFQALMLLNEPGPERHQQLKRSVRQEAVRISPFDLHILYAYLTNTARVVFTDRQTYFRALFDLYREQSDLDILHINGHLTPILLLNITVAGLKLQEFDWVQQFIDKNADKILPSYLERDDVVTLCKAHLHFEKKEFNETLEMINMLHYDNLFIKIDERRIRLMCYFELNLYLPLEDLIASFRKFLTDHKKSISSNYIKENRLFIHFMYKLAFDQLNARENRQALSDEISKVPVLPKKEWFLAKLQEE